MIEFIPKFLSWGGLLPLMDSSTKSATPLQIYDHTLQIVQEFFYDPTFRGLPWNFMVQKYRHKINNSTPESELKNIVNHLLSYLQASHTRLLSSSDQEYWALKSVLSEDIDDVAICQIGAWFEFIDNKWFVKNVFDHSIAEKAGILPGDEVLSANNQPFNPVHSFLKEDRPVRLSLKRFPKEPPRDFQIIPVIESIQRTLFKATLSSRKIYMRSGKRIGYFHLWAGTNDVFKAALERVATDYAEKTDAFILDLRDGFGGAYPAYLDPFLEGRDSWRLNIVYKKPLIALINEGTRSGKEWISFLLKKSQRATLIGTRTAGYFLGGKIFEIETSQYMLYLAVEGNEKEDADLEGKGVKPDIWVSKDLRYSSGKDPQLQFALKIASQK